MSVVLLILKIIGIVLLVLLGLLLLAVLSLLFVPIRYRISGQLEEEFDLKLRVRVSWFLHAISFQAWYEKGNFQKKIRILGIPLELNRNKDGPKAKKEDKTKKRRADKKRKPVKAELQRRSRSESDEDTGELISSNDSGVPEYVKKKPDIKPDFSEEDRKEAEKEEILVQPKSEADRDVAEEEANEILVSVDTSSDRKDIGNQEQKKGKLSTIRNFFQKLKSLPRMIKSKLETLKEKAKNIKKLAERVLKEWRDEGNRSAIKLVWQELKGILKHFLPEKIRMEAFFSTGSPDTTGQVLGAISMIPLVYRYDIHVIPDFEAERFYVKGSFDLKGHVRGIHGMLLLYHIIKDKNIRTIIQRYRNS